MKLSGESFPYNTRKNLTLNLVIILLRNIKLSISRNVKKNKIKNDLYFKSVTRITMKYSP